MTPPASSNHAPNGRPAGALALQLGLLAMLFELGLTRVSGGPQAGGQVIFDSLIGTGLAIGVWALGIWGERKIGRLGVWADRLAIALPVTLVCLLISLLTLQAEQHPLALVLSLGWGALVAGSLVLCRARLPERICLLVAGILLMMTPCLLWMLRDQFLPATILFVLAGWLLVGVGLIIRVAPIVPLLVGLAAWAPFSLASQPTIPWAGAAGAADGPDIVLIVADTLRADYAATMPVVQALAVQGIDYKVVQAGSSWTLPSMATIMSSRPVQEHGGLITAEREKLVPQGAPFLAEVLRDAGWNTAAVVATNPNAGPRFGFDRGFEYADFDGSLCYRQQLPVARGHRAQPLYTLVIFRAVSRFRWAPLLRWLEYDGWDDGSALLERIQRVLEAPRERPLFLWTHFMDVHLPYQHAASLPGVADAKRGPLVQISVASIREDQSWQEPENQELLRQAYAWEVLQLNRTLERLLDLLGPPPERGRIIVLTADHGEEFFEHGGFEHGHAFWQEVIGVPLVIAGSGHEALQQGKLPVASLDIAPTILDLAGLEIAPGMRGRSLLKPMLERPLTSMNLLYAEDPEEIEQAYTVRLGNWKLISLAGHQLFDLAADPAETTDHAGQQLQRLSELEAARPAPPQHGQPAEIDAADEAALRALGYID